MNKSIRHGELLLKPVKTIPTGEVTTSKAFIAAHSETGHHHVLESKRGIEITKISEDSVWVEIFEPTNLVHKKEVDKHNTLVVNPGKYELVKKTEYDPWDKVIREVHD